MAKECSLDLVDALGPANQRLLSKPSSLTLKIYLAL
jgi:hypothetical protein